VNINFKENMEKTANIKIRKIYTDLVVILPKEIFTFNWPRHQTRKNPARYATLCFYSLLHLPLIGPFITILISALLRINSSNMSASKISDT